MIGETIPVLGALTGLIVPIAVFIWLYHEEKDKHEAVIEKGSACRWAPSVSAR